MLAACCCDKPAQSRSQPLSLSLWLWVRGRAERVSAGNSEVCPRDAATLTPVAGRTQSLCSQDRGPPFLAGSRSVAGTGRGPGDVS